VLLGSAGKAKGLVLDFWQRGLLLPRNCAAPILIEDKTYQVGSSAAGPPLLGCERGASGSSGDCSLPAQGAKSNPH